MHNKKIYIYIVLLISAFFIAQGPAFASISNLELKGTIFTNALQPIAIIRDMKTDKINMYEKGETIGNMQLVDVKRGEVTLQEGKNIYVLVLPGGAAQPGNVDMNIVKKEAVYYMSRAEVNKAILKAPQIMRDIKIMPHFASGKIDGIKVSNIKKESIFEKAGVKQGDIVKDVNGMTLNTPFQIFNAYKKLKDSKKFEVKVSRESKPVLLTYIVE